MDPAEELPLAEGEDSLSDLESSGSLAECLASLRKGMEEVNLSSVVIKRQVKKAFQRAEQEDRDWFRTPLRPYKRFRVWAVKQGLDERPTIEAFFQKLFDKAHLDLETRLLTFEESEAALFGLEAGSTMHLFDLFAKIPQIFR